MLAAYDIKTQHEQITVTTPAGWVVTVTIEDAHNARFDVAGRPVINRVPYQVWGTITEGHLVTRLRRDGYKVPDPSRSAYVKAQAEVATVVPHITKRMKTGTATRDAMLAEATNAILRIEEHMKMLAAARAALMTFSEELSECDDVQLEGVASAREREQIAQYYEPRQAAHIPYYTQQITGKIRKPARTKKA